jgi:hypothetical protein
MKIVPEVPGSKDPRLDQLLALQRNGYGVLPLAAGTKSPPPAGLTGEEGENLTPDQIRDAFTAGRFGNVAARLPLGVIGVDVDNYGTKKGGTTWQGLGTLAKEAGTPIPETVRVTSRADRCLFSGIYLFRAELPPGRTWIGSVAGIDVLRYGHRYAVCPPSIHPEDRPYLAIDEASGDEMDVLPPVNKLPTLPLAVVMELTQPMAEPRESGAAITAQEASDDPERGYGHPCKVVQGRSAEAHAALTRAGSRHDATVQHLQALTRLHEQGHTGALGVINSLRAAFILAVTTDNPKTRTSAEAQSEYDRALSGAWQNTAARPTPESKRGCCSATRHEIREWIQPGSTGQNEPPRPLGDVLDDVLNFLARYVVFPSKETATASALWVAHAHALTAFDSTPRLAFLSPEPGSGKSRALEVISTLVPRAMHAVNATPAALFRSVGDDGNSPAILFDEIDTVFGNKVADGNEDLRGFINAGHRRGAVAYRCVGMGTNQTVQAFPAYCAMALAGLHELPDTISTRSIIVNMRKRAPQEHVNPWRTRNEPQGHAIRNALAHAIAPHMEELHLAEPVMPEGVEDRPADVWEPLLAIADAAGGEWPSTARHAASILTLGRELEPSRGVQLLTALHSIWEECGAPENLSTTELLAALNRREEEPWLAMRGGAGIDARGLANLLGKYGVKSKTVRVGEATAKGYTLDQLSDPWARYCSLTQEKGNSRHMGNTPHESGEMNPEDMTAEPSHKHEPSHEYPSPMGDVTDVTDVTDISEQQEGAPLTCPECGESMNPDLPAMGYSTHPGCMEEE